DDRGRHGFPADTSRRPGDERSRRRFHRTHHVRGVPGEESVAPLAGVAALSMATTRACPVCGSVMRPAFRSLVLRKHDVEYWHCNDCGFLCTEEPYWLEEAYADAIVVEDTGIMQRNLVMAARLASLLYFRFDARGRFVDVAGGYGVLVRLMRDLGLDFYWS